MGGGRRTPMPIIARGVRHVRRGIADGRGMAISLDVTVAPAAKSLVGNQVTVDLTDDEVNQILDHLRARGEL